MMLHQGRGNGLLGAVLLLAVASANAEGVQSHHLNRVEVSAAAGVGWYNTSNTNLVISPYETDSDQVNKSTVRGAWKVGVGYYLFENPLPRQYLNQLLLELNVYQTFTHLEGDVWQYGLPPFNNYSFTAPIRSTRLMLDLKPNLFTWQKISPYAILGVGMTWNTVSYTETVTDAGTNPNSALSLSNNTTTHVAWDVGAGFKVALTDKLSATAEYIDALLGNGSPRNGANTTAVPNFLLHNQSVLLGLSLKL